jgi:hypothetical protein
VGVAASIAHRATIIGIGNVTETGTGIVVTQNDIRRRVMSTSDRYFLPVSRISLGFTAIVDEIARGHHEGGTEWPTEPVVASGSLLLCYRIDVV